MEEDSEGLAEVTTVWLLRGVGKGCSGALWVGSPEGWEPLAATFWSYQRGSGGGGLCSASASWHCLVFCVSLPEPLGV